MTVQIFHGPSFVYGILFAAILTGAISWWWLAVGVVVFAGSALWALEQAYRRESQEWDK